MLLSQSLLLQPSRVGRGPHDTNLQTKQLRSGCTSPLPGQALSQGFVVRPLSVSPGCFNCHMIRPVSSNGWSMCKCCKERFSEKQVRKHMRVRDRKNRDAETRNNQLRKESEKEELLWLLWPPVLFSLSGDWAVLACIWLYNISQHYPVTQLLLKLVGVGSSSSN